MNLRPKKNTKDLLSELEKYENKGKFSFALDNVLRLACNIPKRSDYSGLYIFYSQNQELLYVSISGREGADGKIIHRRDGLRGRFLTGKQFKGIRSKTLPNQMKLESILNLEIHWFITYDEKSNDFPRKIEKAIIAAFKSENEGKRPRWNKRD